MKGTKVASRYAKALLDLAVEQKKVDSVLGDMHFLLQTNNDAREFELLIASPIIDAEENSCFQIGVRTIRRSYNVFCGVDNN